MTLGTLATPVPKRPAEISAVDAAMVTAVIVAGFGAAHFVLPALWIVTPAVAALLLRNAARPRAAESAAPLAPLPSRVERLVAEAFAALPAGESRDLLAEVVRRARALVVAFAGQPDEHRLTRDVTDLVEACCEIAREHSRLDAVLPAVWEPALAPAGARGASDDVSADGLRRRGDASRELLAKRLLDAAVAMDELLVQRGVESGAAAAERVAELTSELAAEAAARRHAAREIQRVLESE